MEPQPAAPREITLSQEPFLPPGMDDQAWNEYKAIGDVDKRTTIAKMDAFLVAFAGIGTIRSAAPAGNVHRGHVSRWISENLYHFRPRFELAILAFRDGLQDIGLARIRAQKPNDNPLLLVTYLNAHWPEKYRRDTVIVGSDAVKEMLAELVKLAGKGRGQVIEGETVSAEEKVNRMLGPGPNAPARNDAPREKQDSSP